MTDAAIVLANAVKSSNGAGFSPIRFPS